MSTAVTEKIPFGPASLASGSGGPLTFFGKALTPKIEQVAPPASPPAPAAAPERGAQRVGRAREVKQRDGGAAQGTEILRRRRPRDLFGFGTGGPLV